MHKTEWNQVITIEKQDKTDADFAFFKQFIKGRSEDDLRLVLQYIKVTKEQMIVTDGRRLHIADNIYDLPEGLWLPLVQKAKIIVLVPDRDGMTYPNYKQTIPEESEIENILPENGISADSIQMHLGKKGVCCNHDYIDLVVEMNGVISIDLFIEETSTSPIILKCRARNFTGVIMPLRID